MLRNLVDRLLKRERGNSRRKLSRSKRCAAFLHALQLRAPAEAATWPNLFRNIVKHKPRRRRASFQGCLMPALQMETLEARIVMAGVTETYVGSGGAITVDLEAQTISEAGMGTVSYPQVDTLVIDTMGGALTVNALPGDDEIEVTPLTSAVPPVAPESDNGTLRVLNSATPVVNYRGVTTVEIGGGGGQDTIIVNGTSASTAEAFVVNDTAVVTPSGTVTYNGPEEAIEALVVNGRQGNDTFTVTPSATLPIFIDGGDPIGLVGDTLNILAAAAVTYNAGPANDGSFFVTGTEPVSFGHIEAATVLGAASARLNATNGDDVITVLSRDDSTHAGADGVRDFTVQANDGPEIFFGDTPRLTVSALGGSDEITVRSLAPNNANWDVDVLLDGGTSSAGNRVLFASPGSTSESVFYTPQLGGSATLVVNPPGNNNSVRFVADTPGFAGNDISVEYVSGGALGVAVTGGTEITVTVTPTTTAQEVIGLINADAASSSLVTASAFGPSDGVVAAVAEQFLSGGGSDGSGTLAVNRGGNAVSRLFVSAIEELIYDGGGGGDTVTFNSENFDNVITHTPSSAADAGAFAIASPLGSLLGLSYQNLGLNATLNVDSTFGTTTFINVGSDGDDRLVLSNPGFGVLIADVFTGGNQTIDHVDVNLINFGNFSSIILDGRSGSDSFAVAPDTGLTTTVLGSDGDDALLLDVSLSNNVPQVSIESNASMLAPGAKNGLLVEANSASILEYQGIEEVQILGSGNFSGDSIRVMDDGRDNVWSIGAGEQVRGAPSVRVGIDDRSPLLIGGFRLHAFDNSQGGVDHFVVSPSRLPNAFYSITGFSLQSTLEVQGTESSNLFTVTDFEVQMDFGPFINYGAVGTVVLNGHGADDTFLVNANTTPVRTPVHVVGGDGFDTLQVQGNLGTGVDEVIYTPGPALSDGLLRYEDGLDARLMSITFTGLEPVQDAVPATTVTVNGTNGNNAINYSAGTNAGNDIFDGIQNTGLVSVDGFETIEFANKAELTINGLAGDDTINLNNPTTPTGLTGINVNGGDPTSSDVVIVNNTEVATTVVVNTLSDDGAVVTGAQPVPVTIDGAERLTINGQGNDDDLNVVTPVGSDRIVYTPGVDATQASLDIHSLTGSSYIAINYLDFDVDAGLVLDDASATRDDQLDFRATGAGDEFTVDAAGAINLNEVAPGSARQTLDVLADGVRKLNLFGLDGDDIFNVAGDHPFTSGLTVQGGNPSASDVLNFTGSGIGAVTLDLEAQTVLESGQNPVNYTGIEIINLDAGGVGPTIEATDSDDDITVTVFDANSGKVERGFAVQQLGQVATNVVAPTVFYSNLGDNPVNFDLGGGEDTLVVVGSTFGNRELAPPAPQVFDIDVPNATVTVDDNPNVAGTNGTVTWTNNESLAVFGLEGDDTFNVTPGSIPVFVDGGDPIGQTAGDLINVIGGGNPVVFEAGPESDEGGFIVGANARVSFDHIEEVVFSAAMEAFIQGTNGDDDITVIARDDSTHAGADGVQDFTVSVNEGPSVLFLDTPQLVIDALAGDDDIVIRAPAPNNADWNMEIWVLGGAPAAATGDQGDVLLLETPSFNAAGDPVADNVIYTPTGVGSGTLVIDEDADGVFGGTDTIINIGILPPPMDNVPTPDPGGIELVVYDGEAGNDVLTIVGDGGGVNTDDQIVHRVGDAADDGSFHVNSFLPIVYEDIGLTGRLVVDGGGAGGNDELVFFGTNADDQFTVEADPGPDENAVRINGAIDYLDVFTTAVNDVTLIGLDGNDSFTVNLNNSFSNINVQGNGPGASDSLIVLGVAGTVENLTVNPATTPSDGSVVEAVSATTINYSGVEHVFLSGNTGDADTLDVNDDLRDNTWTVSSGTVGDLVQIAGRESIDYSVFADVTLNNTFGTDDFNIHPSNLTGFLNSLTVNGDGITPVDDVLRLIGTPGNDVVTSTATVVTMNGVGITAGTGLAELAVQTLAGNDNITLALALPGVRKVIEAGAGNDVVDMSATDDAFIFGGDGDDFLIGSPTGDLIDGGRGNDVLFGLAGNDTLIGGEGNDILNGGLGADQMFGHEDSDILIWNPGDGNDLVEGGDGEDILQFMGGSGADTMTLSADGTRLRFERQPGNIVLDVAQAEQVDANYTATFAGVLSQAQEVPAPLAVPGAYGTLVMVYNSATNTFDIEVAAFGLSGPVTGFHLHAAAPGVAGGVIVPFLPTDLAPDSSGALRARLTNVALPAANITDLLAGNTYINIHTALNPAGEIRAQANFGSNPLTALVAAGFGGADTFTVNDITPTAVDVVNVGLGAMGLDADATDDVTVNGRTTADNLVVTTTGGAVNIAGLRYDVNITGSLTEPDDDRLTINGNEGDDVIRLGDGVEGVIDVTLNGGDGNDQLFAGLGHTSSDTILNGGPGDDFLQGGSGIDTINGGPGDDIMVGGTGDDTFDGGTGFDTILVQGTLSNDRIDLRQDSPTQLRYEVGNSDNGLDGILGGAGTETDTLVIATVEQVRILAGDGDDRIRVAHDDALVAVGVFANMLRIDVDGEASGTSDQLTVIDDGLGDTTVHRIGGTAGEGSFTMYSFSGGVSANSVIALPPVVYTGIESAGLNPIGPVLGGMGTDGNGRLFVFKHDPFEENESLPTATFLGASPTINLDATIDPGADVPFGRPGDEDWYRVVAETTGTLDFQVYFRQQGTLTNGRAGLPGDGNLDIAVYDADGLVGGAPLAIAGSGTFGTNDDDDDERVRIPAVAGQTYYLRVVGAALPTGNDPNASGAINVYNVAVINLPAPVPFDLELDDQPVGDPPPANSDTGRSQFDNVTRDNTPTIIFRFDDNLFRNDLPGNDTAGNPLGDAAIPIPFRPGAAQPNQPGYAIAIFDEGDTPGGPAVVAPQTPLGFASLVGDTNNNGIQDGNETIEWGVYQFTTPVLADGSHFLTARVQMLDPATPLRTGFGGRSASLEIIVDTVVPPISFGQPGVPNDGLIPDSDTSIIPNPDTIIDRFTSDATPTFWGRAEANTIVRVFADHPTLGTQGVLDANDVFLGQDVAEPFDGTNQEPDGFWMLESIVNLNNPLFFPMDGVRTVFVTAEDLAGSVNQAGPAQADTLRIFVDTQGPRIDSVVITSAPGYDLFDPEPSTDGPTPLVNSLTIKFTDPPNRVGPDFLINALKLDVASQPGHFRVVGDANGVIPIAQVIVTNLPPVAGMPAMATVQLVFAEPLPDDRFTLIISDSITDRAGNPLDGENNAIEPQENPLFPTGDGVPGGDFVARFTVKPENVAPVANDDRYVALPDAPLTVDALTGVLANDLAVNVGSGMLTVTALNGVAGAIGMPTPLPSGAMVTLNANGSFTYVAPVGTAASDSFVYNILDPVGASAQATVTIDLPRTVVQLRASQADPMRLDLVIEDIEPGGKNDNLSLSVVNGKLFLTDTLHLIVDQTQFPPVVGLQIPIESITGQNIIVNLAGGDDLFNIDLSGLNGVGLDRSLTINGGDGDNDRLVFSSATTGGATTLGTGALFATGNDVEEILINAPITTDNAAVTLTAKRNLEVNADINTNATNMGTGGEVTLTANEQDIVGNCSLVQAGTADVHLLSGTGIAKVRVQTTGHVTLDGGSGGIVGCTGEIAVSAQTLTLNAGASVGTALLSGGQTTITEPFRTSVDAIQGIVGGLGIFLINDRPLTDNVVLVDLPPLGVRKVCPGPGCGSPEGEGSPLRNSVNWLDVNNDGAVSPVDVLAVVNFLNGPGVQSEGPSSNQEMLYVDVNGDYSVSPVDALAIINYLNRTQLPASEGESSPLGQVEIGLSEPPSQPLTANFAAAHGSNFMHQDVQHVSTTAVARHESEELGQWPSSPSFIPRAAPAEPEHWPPLRRLLSSEEANDELERVLSEIAREVGSLWSNVDGTAGP